ncbi:hypothetical protein ACTL6P_15430 [Endozoicomonas acroporae]|uniref:hypothetical protein n=1 Tax=Endozoicomonas acroporae TaxID=1701104 RepID=UPI0015E086F2|nr:hypothetical protein [Endozoicomonas acroporae]
MSDYEDECYRCGSSYCDGLKNCECGEDMRCDKEFCYRCEQEIMIENAVFPPDDIEEEE